MTNFSRTQSPVSADAVLASIQSQAMEQEEQQNHRTNKREHEEYKSRRALDHARSESAAKKEAVKKGKAVSKTRAASLTRSDSLKAAGEEVGNSFMPTAKKGAEELQKPQMPTPTTPFGSNPSDDDSTNVMAIIARVMVMMTNVQVKGWSTFWQLGAKNVNTSLQMSQAEAQNTQQQYQEQSNATKKQASRAGGDGQMQLATFGMAVGAGFMAGPTDAEMKQPPSDEAKMKTETDPNPTEGENDESLNPEDELATTQNSLEAQNASSSGAPSDATEQAETDEQRGARVEETEWEKAKRGIKEGGSKMWKSTKSGLSSGAKRFWEGNASTQKVMGRFFGNGYKYIQVIQPGMQGAQNLAVDKPSLSKQAVHEKDQGIYAAAASLARGYSEYNNQIFNRNEDIRQQTSQGIDYAMNIYKSASDSLTQAVSTMAR
ncbi:MAG: hypothetical protein S4CHLAM81_15360 [Chlamydiales bacterium]|nr:hypothetical protein [Chlamydiales bacterium]MCH9636305.1 hypothetical protein [Chlamydiales bacterium]MCH9703970.1 hypothetical protein [Chlamydiota bacterium]